MKRRSVFGCLVGWAAVCGASEFEPMAAEDAFKARAWWVGPGRVKLRLEAADGYSIYARKLSVASMDAAWKVVQIILPKQVSARGDVGRLRGEATVMAKVAGGVGVPLRLRTTVQGCADIGLCYPPIQIEVPVMEFVAPSEVRDAAGAVYKSPAVPIDGR